METLRFYLTGRVLIETPKRTIDEAKLGGRQGRLLLAYLVLSGRGRRLSTSSSICFGPLGLRVHRTFRCAR